MKKLFLLTAIICTMLIGCTKEITCQQNNTGTLNVSCTSSNPYNISVDGVNEGTIAGNGSNSYQITTGTHTVIATQQSGYTLIPTIKTAQITISRCESSSFAFP